MMLTGMPLLGTYDSTCLDFSDLVSRIRAGSKAAIGDLYSQLLPGMKAYIKRRIGSEYEDILQESFLILLQAIESGAMQNPSALRPYLCTVMSRTCKVAYRNPRQLELEDTHAQVNGSGTVEELSKQFERAAKRACITDALDRIPERMRIVIEKCFLEEKSNEQVKEELGLTETQFRITKSRAKSRLIEEVRRIQSLQNLKNSVSSKQGRQWMQTVAVQ